MPGDALFVCFVKCRAGRDRPPMTAAKAYFAGSAAPSALSALSIACLMLDSSM